MLWKMANAIPVLWDPVIRRSFVGRLEMDSAMEAIWTVVKPNFLATFPKLCEANDVDFVKRVVAWHERQVQNRHRIWKDRSRGGNATRSTFASAVITIFV